MKIEIASLKDTLGIYKALKNNLIEIKDFDKIPEEKIRYLEDHGFLRKEVPKEYYESLIKKENSKIYIAKIKNDEIVGFGSIHLKKYNIENFRSTLDKLNANDEKIRALLLDEDKEFAFLDQVSILHEHQRKGVGLAIVEKILEDINVPIVSFIVKLPLANKASARWHEKLGFELAATCDGGYKGKKFEWWIYIHWNKK